MAKEKFDRSGPTENIGTIGKPSKSEHLYTLLNSIRQYIRENENECECKRFTTCWACRLEEEIDNYENTEAEIYELSIADYAKRAEKIIPLLSEDIESDFIKAIVIGEANLKRKELTDTDRVGEILKLCPDLDKSRMIGKNYFSKVNPFVDRKMGYSISPRPRRKK